MSQSFHPAGPPAPYHNPFAAPGHLDVPMLFGATAVALMLVCRFRQNRATFLVIGAIVFGFLAGVYGFIAGAWPLGVAEIVCTVGAYREWSESRRRSRTQPTASFDHRDVNRLHAEYRVSRLSDLN